MKPKSWREAIPLLDAVYGREGGSVGCCLHVQVEDGNVENRFFDDESRAMVAEKGHPECIALFELMARMSITQRWEVAKRGGN